MQQPNALVLEGKIQVFMLIILTLKIVSSTNLICGLVKVRSTIKVYLRFPYKSTVFSVTKGYFTKGKSQLRSESETVLLLDFISFSN